MHCPVPCLKLHPPKHPPEYRLIQLQHLPGSSAFARSHSLLKETPLHRVARKRGGFSEVLARDRVPAASVLKLSQRGVVERIASQTAGIRDPTNLFQPAVRTISLGNRNGAIERHNRGRTHCH